MTRGKIALLAGACALLGFLIGNYAATVSLRSPHARVSDRRPPLAPDLLSDGHAFSAPVAALREPEPLDTPATPAPATPSDYDELIRRHLEIPVLGFDLKNLTDTFEEARGSGKHEALDITAPRGATVIAADDGVVKKLFNSRQGGLTLYQFDSSEQYCFYYAHLDSYAKGVQEGVVVRRGDKLGYVGSTGNAGTPHLHFAIFKLGPEKKWWKGTPINPYPILKSQAY